MEAVYAMVPVATSLQNVSLHVLRFFTAVHDKDGNFQGYLLLSLDMKDLRNIVSRYSSPNAPIAASGTDTRVRSLFFDREGWMIFQSEAPDATLTSKNLGNDAVRAGFWGDYGRPGFSMAFRPGPDHINYWSMVAEVQGGHAGQLPMTESSTIWSNGQMRVERVSYVPVSFNPGSGGERLVLGGLAVLDTSFTTTRTGMQIMGIYAISFTGGMVLLGLSLWWLARQMGKSLNGISGELRTRNIHDNDEDIDLPQLPLEIERIKTGINTLLKRLRRAKEERRSHEALQDAQWQREPAPDLPHPEDLPTSGLVGTSPAMHALHDQVRKASQVLADVLVVGETGTGKELVSEAIHRLSARSSGPFITINCGALDENLLMDTLFGHVKGAFTEARQPRKGAFLAAEGGTLMLDEIGNAAPKVQQALLRALSTRRIRPLGSDQEVPFDTRIIAATNAALLDGASDGSFREDLYYRLAVITIHTPPLRERKIDIPSLTVYFLTEAVKARAKAAEADAGTQPENTESTSYGPASSPAAQGTCKTLRMPQVSRGALAKLTGHDWPGNVRELKNTLTRALTFCEGDILYAENIQLGPIAASATPDKKTMARRKGQDTAEDPAAKSRELPEIPQAQAAQKATDQAGETNPAALANTGSSPGLPAERQDGHERQGQNASGSHPAFASPAQDALRAANSQDVHAKTDRSNEAGEANGIPPDTSACWQESAPFAAGFTPSRRDAMQHPLADAVSNGKSAIQAAMPRLNHRQAEMWPRIEQAGSISRQEYQQMVGENISMRTAQYDLQLFVQMGLVRKEGRGPAQRYVLAPGGSFSG